MSKLYFEEMLDTASGGFKTLKVSSLELASQRSADSLQHDSSRTSPRLRFRVSDSDASPATRRVKSATRTLPSKGHSLRRSLQPYVGRRIPYLLGLLLAFGAVQGCAGNGTNPLDDDLPCGGEGLDLTMEFPAIHDNGLSIRTPPLLVPGGTEILYCYYGIYEGDDAGVTSQLMRASTEGALHHAVLKVGSDDDPPPGTLIDCTSDTIQDSAGAPLFESIGDASSKTNNGGLIALPEGFAFKFPQGLRYIADVHYINSQPEPVCINVAWDLNLIPEDEVETFAASYNLDPYSLSIPPGEETTITFDCPWPEDTNLLSIGGHMHFHGDRYEVEHIREETTLDTIYEVDQWLPDYRFDSPVTFFGPEGFPVEAGDSFRTHCTYVNDGNTHLSYPDEMCTTFGVAFPLNEPLRCEAGDKGESWGKGEGILQGVLRRTPDLVNDGIGDLVIAVFFQEQNGPNGPGAPVATWNLQNADLSTTESEINYTLQGVPIGAEPLYVWVGLDDDGSGLDEGPTAGDLVAEANNLLVQTTTPVTFDFMLEPAS